MSAFSLGLFVINLDRSPERWERISTLLGGLPWLLIRVSALDARDDVQGVLAARGQTLVQPPNGVGWNPLRFRQFSMVEEACFCSHLKALKTFLSTQHSHAVIFEDDAEPLRNVKEELTDILNSGAEFDVVKLEGARKYGARLGIAVRQLKYATLVRSMRPTSGGGAYLVTRAGAERLVVHAGQRLIPVDDFISNMIMHGGVVLHYSPWLFGQGWSPSIMDGGRKHTRYARKRDPWHFLLQLARRVSLRFALWYYVITRPRFALPLRRIRW